MKLHLFFRLPNLFTCSIKPWFWRIMVYSMLIWRKTVEKKNMCFTILSLKPVIKSSNWFAVHLCVIVFVSKCIIVIYATSQGNRGKDWLQTSQWKFNSLIYYTSICRWFLSHYYRCKTTSEINQGNWHKHNKHGNEIKTKQM